MNIYFILENFFIYLLLLLDGYPFPRISCGVIEGVYSTIDFGIDKDVNATFDLMRKYSPKGPLVNSEVFIIHDNSIL